MKKETKFLSETETKSEVRAAYGLNLQADRTEFMGQGEGVCTGKIKQNKL